MSEIHFVKRDNPIPQEFFRQRNDTIIVARVSSEEHLDEGH